MFCADYISSFLFHGLLNLGLIHYPNIKVILIKMVSCILMFAFCIFILIMSDWFSIYEWKFILQVLWYA
jgi:hypothetical protein